MEKNYLGILFILSLQALLFFFYKNKFFLKAKKNDTIFSNFLINFFCLIFLIILLYFLLKNYFLFENFTDLRDNASINTSFAYLNNIDPFSEKYYEKYANLYSRLYPQILAKIYIFFNIQNNQFFFNLNLIAKILNLLLAIFIAIFFLFFLNYKKKNLALFLLILISFIMSPWISGTSPNLFGYFFFTTGLGIFFFYNNFKYNFISYFLVFLSSFFKQYYILGIIPIFLTSFFLRKKFFDFIYLFLIFIFYFLLYFNNNIYFDILFDFHLKYSSEIKFELIRIFYETFFILVWFPFLFFFPICSYIFKINLNTKQIIFLKTYFFLIFFVVLKMWTSSGNFGNYTIQLFTPILLFLSITYLNQIKLKYNIDKILFIILFFSCLTINNSRIYGIMNNKYIDANKVVYNYIKDLQILNKNKLFYVDGFVSSSFFDIKSNVVYDAGMTNYISIFIKKKKSLYENIHEIFTDEFDFIICSLECSPDLTKYKLVNTLFFYAMKQGKTDLYIFKKIN
jgi:hypothetical protein